MLLSLDEEGILMINEGTRLPFGRSPKASLEVESTPSSGGMSQYSLYYIIYHNGG